MAILPAENRAQLTTLADLARPNLKIVLTAKEVPVGQYILDFLSRAAQNLEFTSTYEAAVLQNVVFCEDSVRGVLSKVALGEANAGVVYSSDVSGEEAARVLLIAIPIVLNVMAEYPFALLADLGITLAFVVLAQVFVAAPFYIKSAAAGFAAVDEELQQAAALDGASRWKIFRYITAPLAWSAVLGGAVTTWARIGRVWGHHHLCWKFYGPHANHAARHLPRLRIEHRCDPHPLTSFNRLIFSDVAGGERCASSGVEVAPPASRPPHCAFGAKVDYKKLSAMGRNGWAKPAATGNCAACRGWGKLCSSKFGRCGGAGRPLPAGLAKR